MLEKQAKENIVSHFDLCLKGHDFILGAVLSPLSFSPYAHSHIHTRTDMYILKTANIINVYALGVRTNIM